MGFNIRTFREIALKKLSAKEGQALEISCNLTSPAQFGLIIESYAHGVLGSTYTTGEKDQYLRITKSYNSEYANNVVKIGMTPEIANKLIGGDDGS